MGTLVFQANLGGAVNLIGPNTASTVNFTLPSADGTSGQALVTNGSGTLSFSTFTSGAAGSNTQVQFNSSGAFAGSANLTFNGTTLTSNALTVTNATTLSAGTANGVAYLNGSKVVTTGSALTFNGSNSFSYGDSNAGGYNTLNVNNTSSTGYSRILFNIGSSGANGVAAIKYAPGVFMQIGPDSNDTTTPLVFAVNNGTEGMRLTSTGLGIGTSSPSAKLQVDSATSLSAGNNYYALVGNTSSASRRAVALGVNADGNALVAAYNTFSPGLGSLFLDGSDLQFRTGSTTRATLDSSGNLGIGTSSPNSKLQVQGLIRTSSSAAGLQIDRRDTSASAYTLYSTAGNLQFYNGTSDVMTLDASGNLLVGDTSNASGTPRLYAKSSGNTIVARFYGPGLSDSNTTVYFDKPSTTNTTSQTFVAFTINSQATGCGQINANGASQAAFGSFSDARLKENIVDLPSQLSNIMALRPVEFDYIASEGGGHQTGFIAQDMEKIYPDSVGERADGMKTLTGWGKTEARLIKALQEMKAIIDDQAARIAALEAK